MDNLPDTQIESTIIESSPKSEEDEALDPRVQIELERLNHANEAINHLELQLDEARKTLKEFWETSETNLFQLEKRIGSAVSKAKSYYDTRIKLRDGKEILTKAKHRFERAQTLHVAAKELALVSAEHIDEAKNSDQNAATWNETYIHAMAKAADAEREKYQADIDQQRAERVYLELEKTIEKLQKDFRRSINKSQPYYEMKAEYYKELDFQKRKVYDLENCVNEAKSQYQQSLRTLEHISNEIHEQRNQGKIRKELGERTSGVGEEQITYTETKSPPIPENIPTISIQTNRSDEVLRSCLLRTESLPTGIFTNPHNRYLSEGDETPDITNDLNNQFILCSKQAPYPTMINKSEPEMNHILERTPSFSSQISQMTDDSDKTGSLHVLSDEQLDHLAYEYHPYSPDISFETDPINELILELQNTSLQAKTFFRKLFKTNTINN